MKARLLAFALVMPLGVVLVSCVRYPHNASSNGKMSSASSQRTERRASVKTSRESHEEADWGGSSIYATTTSKVTLALWKDGKLVAKDNKEIVADGETDRVHSEPRVIEFSNAPPGNYELRVSGRPKTHYDVEIHDYDSEMNEAMTTRKGVIAKTETCAIQFKHGATQQNAH